MILLGVAGIISAFFIYMQSSRPVYHGEMHDRGVQEEVKVFFDQYGIPHIYAKNEKDAYFTLGYVHAQERLFQMEMLRRVGAGRLSEILGKDFVSVDAFFRTLGIHKTAKESAGMFFAKPTEEWQKNTLSYIQGINSFMFHGATPPEFLLIGIPKVKFTPEDIYLITGYMSFSFAEALRSDPILDKIYSKLGPEYMRALEWTTDSLTETKSDSTLQNATDIALFVDDVFNKLPVKPWLGSNAWAIAPSRSTTGTVLLSNDTHIGYQQPAVWFEAHVEYPGHSIYGNYLAGIPFPLVGHNRNVSWGLTMLENDDMNLYREKAHSKNKNSYEYKGVWEQFRKTSEVIKVKGGADTTITIRETVHGPVINDVITQLDTNEVNPVSLWWTYTRFPVTVLQVTHQLSEAVTVEDGRKAASKVNAPGLNIVMGDTKGNIGHWAAARLPVYKKGMHTNIILDGSSGENDIEGYYEFVNNPQSENPASGILISANNQPDSLTALFPGYYAPAARVERIEKLLQTKEKWSAAELKNISTDIISDLHPQISGLIINVIGDDTALVSTPVHREAARLLLTWNGNHEVSDTTPTIYYKLLSTIFEMAMADELGKEDYNTFVNTHLMKNSYLKFLSDSGSGWWNDINTEASETRKEIFTAAFRKTIEELKNSSGEITNWAWGGAHTLEHLHPVGKRKILDKIFNVGPVAIKGGIETINNAGFLLNTSGKYPVTYGPAMRIILDMGDIENGWSVLPTGQSGHVRSPHYFDQSRMHVSGNFRPMMMNKNTIEEMCTNILTFKAK